MKTSWWRLLTVIILVAMVAGPMGAGSSVQAAPSVSSKTSVQAPPPDQPDPTAKLDGELKVLAQQGGTETVAVLIVVEKGTDLSRVADVIEVRPYMEGQLIFANVQQNKLTKLATTKGVVVVGAYHQIQRPITSPDESRTQLTKEQTKQLRADYQAKLAADKAAREQKAAASAGTTSTQSAGTQDWLGAQFIKAPEAWAKGYQGQGVNVAVIDSGVDFGHPDLNGLQATYPSGPFEGWPIAFDPRSMRELVYDGYTSVDNFIDDADYSWYANTYVFSPDTDSAGETVDTMLPWGYDTWMIAKDLVDMSKSGKLFWGIHPDTQLYDYVYDWVPFILIDSTTAGVYDTVIADLNFDHWFDGYDAVANKADPVLSVDLGSFLLEDTLVPAGTQYVPNTEFGAPPTWYGTPEMVTDPAGETLGAGTFIYAYNHNTDLATYMDAMDGADGTADVSGGMVYYIADGVHRIPGMDYLYPDFSIPQNASLVAFMLGSDYAGGGDHGTLCASAVAGQGNIKGYYGIYGEIAQYETADFANFPFGVGGDASTALDFLRPANQGTVQGPAPKAKIIALGDNYEAVNGMQGFLDSYTFLAYGVDGVPNSGDEFVDIMSMSYGDGSVHEDGWDIESRLLAYYNLNYLPNTAMMTSAGNGGSGFGTVSAPNPYTGITVAASTSYGISDVFGGALTLDQINQGEITPFSNRGPNAMGQPDPQVSAGGAWAAGDAPLNLAGIYNTYMGMGLFSGDGNMAWEEWGGTSRSAPESAGVMALLYQAYKEANGEFPTWEKARELIMSSAEDLSHDVLVQGAGRVDADRGTDVAAGLAGFSVSPAQFSAGESMGEGFASVMMPGDTATQTLTVDNPTADAATLTVGDEVLARMEGETQEYIVDVTPDGREDPYPGTYYYYPTYFVIPEAGAALTQHGADLAIPIPAGAEMMQVQMVAPFGLFDQNYQDPYPWTVSYNQSADHRFSMAVYAWTDRNGDGILWDDVDGDKAVNPINGTDVIDHAYIGPTLETEINRFGYSYNHSNLQEVTVRLTGEDRTGTNQPKIVIGITHNKPNVGRSGAIQVRVVFYQKADWDLVSTSATSLTVPAGGSATFDATVTVPADMATGLYEGAITVADDDHTTLVPVTVNVATPSDQMLFNMGGTPEGMLAYDNGRTYAGNQWSSVIEEGDWRFFFYDAMPNMAQKYLYVQNDFGTAALENMPTMDETVGFTPNTGDQFSLIDPTDFGPYSMTYSGGTWDSHGPQNGWGTPRVGSWNWDDQYGDPLPQTRSWLDLNDGLNLVEFRNILSSGKHVDGDPFTATVGVLGVDAPETLVINTNQLSGSYPIDVISPTDGMIAYASGVNKPYHINGITVPQGTDIGNTPPADLLSGYVYTFDVANADEIDVFLSSARFAGSDADIYLLFDANKDGIFNPYDPKEILDYSDNSGSFEEIYYSGSSAGLPFVADGKYAVAVYGYYMVPGDTVDLAINIYGGTDININNVGSADNWMIDTMAGVRTTTNLNWQIPSSGVWYGSLYFGMVSDDHMGIQGPWIRVDVVINAGGVDLSGSTFTVDKAEIGMRRVGSAPAILNYTLEVVNSGTEMVPVEISNLLPPELSGSMVSWENEAGQKSDSLTMWDDLNGIVMVGPASGKYTFHYRAAVQTGFVGMITNRVRLNAGIGGVVTLSPITLDAAADTNQASMIRRGADLPPVELTATTNVLYTTMLSTVLR